MTNTSEYSTSLASGKVIPFNCKFHTDLTVNITLLLPLELWIVLKDVYCKFGPDAIKSIAIGGVGTVKVAGKGWLLYYLIVVSFYFNT